MIQFKTISSKKTIDLRHRVLWPNKAKHEMILPEDEQGSHYGAVQDDVLVAVASVFVDQSDCRLRKFAIDPDYQRQGIGSKMIRYIQADLTARGFQVLYCDARETALGFYQTLGFKIEGSRFMKSHVAYFKATLVMQPIKTAPKD